MFKDLPEGKTHFENDGCGEPAHNHPAPHSEEKKKQVDNSTNKKSIKVVTPPSRQEFEDYLQEVHAAQYVGADDYMSDDYVDWISCLDVQEVIDYAERCLTKQEETLKAELLRELLEKGHGGGNWRRLIIQLLSPRKE